MAGDPGRVRVVLTRSGGLLGRPVRRGLDTAALPEPAATRLRELVRAVWSAGDDATGGTPRGDDRSGAAGTAHGPAGADLFVHTLEIDQAGERLVRTCTEPVPAELRPLVDLLRKAPRLPPDGAPSG
jgi:hypothetical protein